MVTDQQVVLLRQKLMEGKSQQAAAAASGMSVRTARTWQRGRLPSERKGKRRWRTRPDPFAGVWAEEVEPLLLAVFRSSVDYFPQPTHHASEPLSKARYLASPDDGQIGAGHAYLAESELGAE